MHKLAAFADPDNPKIKNFDLLGDTDYKVRITKGDGGCVSSVALPVRRIETIRCEQGCESKEEPA